MGKTQHILEKRFSKQFRKKGLFPPPGDVGYKNSTPACHPKKSSPTEKTWCFAHHSTNTQASDLTFQLHYLIVREQPANFRRFYRRNKVRRGPLLSTWIRHSPGETGSESRQRQGSRRSCRLPPSAGKGNDRVPLGWGRAENPISGSCRRDVLSHCGIREIPESFYKNTVRLFISSDPGGREKKPKTLIHLCGRRSGVWCFLSHNFNMNIFYRDRLFCVPNFQTSFRDCLMFNGRIFKCLLRTL